MSEEWRAGILSAYEIPEERIRSSLEPDHRIVGHRHVTSRRTDYVIEGPHMPVAANAMAPESVALLLTVYDLGVADPERGIEGGIKLTGRWEHSPDQTWTIRRWADWDAFNAERPF